MNDVFVLIAEVGAPIAGALVESLITRVKTINNDMIRLDTSVSAALELTPDLDRIARTENFVEDGTIDARRD